MPDKKRDFLERALFLLLCFQQGSYSTSLESSGTTLVQFLLDFPLQKPVAASRS